VAGIPLAPRCRYEESEWSQGILTSLGIARLRLSGPLHA